MIRLFVFGFLLLTSMVFSTEKWQFTQTMPNTTGLMMPCYKEGHYFNECSDVFLAEVTLSNTFSYLYGLFQPTAIDQKAWLDTHTVKTKSEKMRVQWIGHASCLVQVKSMNILIDPLFDSFHPLFKGKFHAYKRHLPPGIALEDLPPIDLIMISHNHYEHLEEESLKYLQRLYPTVLVPLGLKFWFLQRGFFHVYENNWWEKVIAADEENRITFSATPAIHGSRKRDNLLQNESLWCGWIIQADNKTLYYSGDTAFSKKMFEQIKKQFGPIDIALLPLSPLSDPTNAHMNANQVLDALEILDAKVMIPIHWGTFQMYHEKIEDPVIELQESLAKRPHLKSKVKILKVGQAFTLED